MDTRLAPRDREPLGPGGGPTSARALRSLDELGSVEELWNSFQQHPASDLGHYRACLAHEDGFLRPHIVLLEREGVPRGLVVGTLALERVAWRVGNFTLASRRARVLRIAGSGLLGGCGEDGFRAVAADLMAVLARREADLLTLHEHDPATPLLGALERQAGALQRDFGRRTARGWVLDLPRDYETFRRGLSKKARAGLNHTCNLVRRRLGDGAELVCYRERAQLERLVDDTEAIARRTYHRQAGVGFSATKATRRRLAHALDAGWFRGHVLYAGGRPIAFSHGLLYGNTFHGRHTAFDPDFADLRPGAYLTARIIEELCQAGGVAHFDLGVMDNDFKRSIATRSYARVSTHVFARSLPGLGLALGRLVSAGLDQALRRTLGAANARRLARRLVRLRPSNSARGSAPRE